MNEKVTEHIKIYPIKSVLLGHVIISLIGVLFSLWMLLGLFFSRNLLSSWYQNMILQLGLLFLIILLGCGLTLFYSIKSYFQDKPFFEITSKGIIDRTSAVSPGFVPWGNIKDVELYNERHRVSIGINVHDVNAFNSGKKRSQKTTSIWLKKLPHHILISTDHIQTTTDELRSNILHYKDRFASAK